MGWTVSVKDIDIDTTPELVTELATTYAQLAAEDQLEVLSSNAADIGQVVTVTGINNKGKKVSDTFSLLGATASDSTLTFRYVDQASVDSECAGVITVRRKTGDTFITSIPVGLLDAGMVQHFNGEDDSYVTGWGVSRLTADEVVSFDLRFYPDDADSLDATDGMTTKDSLFLEPENGTAKTTFDQPIRLKAGGWLAVYGVADSANSDARVTISGYDVRP
jgi:hypothetical protein